jgi:hypothetical protein
MNINFKIGDKVKVTKGHICWRGTQFKIARPAPGKDNTSWCVTCNKWILFPKQDITITNTSIVLPARWLEKLP